MSASDFAASEILAETTAFATLPARRSGDDVEPEERLDRHGAREAIPRGWAQLVGKGADGPLATLLTEATAALSGNAPASRDVLAFLEGLKPADEPKRRTSRQPRPAVKPDKPPPKTRRPSERVEPAPAADGLRYYLLGQENVARSARVAYVAVFNSLAERDPDLLSRLEPELRGRKNRGIARSRQALAANEAMTKGAAELPGGWWLLTHRSNKEKVHALKAACAAAGIAFGDRKGLYIDLPNV